MKLISGGMIGNFNCIGTKLNGLILNITPKNINPFLFLQSRLKQLDINDFLKENR